jgi:hypothetical protein
MKTKLALIVTLVLLSVLPSHAAPRWLTAAPRLVGRTYGNMFTFKRPYLAAEQWAVLGASIFDEKTTVDVFSRCPGCTESTLLHPGGGRYGTKTAILNVALKSTFYNSLEQYGDELLRNDPNKFWSHINYAVAAVPLSLFIQGGVHNMGIPATPAAIFPPVCNDHDHDCEGPHDID